MARDSNAPTVTPEPPPRPEERSGASIAAAIGAATLLAAAVLTVPSEGVRTRPYYDPARIETVCVGDTQVQMRSYSVAECLALLQRREARDYASPIAACVPGFADERHRYAFAASIDAAYNAGTAAFCHSRMARAFNGGHWLGGCAGFAGWYATARINGKPTPLKGLQRRREAERDLCLEGETPAIGAGAPSFMRWLAVRADWQLCVPARPSRLGALPPLGPEPTNKTPYPRRLDAA